MDSAIIEKVLFEVEQIEKEINETSPLINSCRVKEPDYIEKRAIALVLHSFYTGIENIMLMIIKNKDSTMPNGMKWHKELLDRALEKTEKRTPIFREELRESLGGYLKFRHFVRHLYGSVLEWKEMKNISLDITAVWKDVKNDINMFIKNNTDTLKIE